MWARSARYGSAAARGLRAAGANTVAEPYSRAARRRRTVVAPGGKGGRKPRFDEDKRELIVKEEGQGAFPARRRKRRQRAR